LTDPGYSTWASWLIFILMTIIIQVTMLNLIIGIIGNVYNNVTDAADAALYSTRAVMCKDNVGLVPSDDCLDLRKNKFSERSPYIMIARKKTETEETADLTEMISQK